MTKRFILGFLLLVIMQVFGQVNVTPQDFSIPDTTGSYVIFRDQLSDSCLILYQDGGFHAYLKHGSDTIFGKYKCCETVTSWPFMDSLICNEKRNDNDSLTTNEEGNILYDTIRKKYILATIERLNEYDTLIIVPNKDNTCVFVHKAMLISKSKTSMIDWSGIWRVLKWLLIAIGFLSFAYSLCSLIPKLLRWMSKKREMLKKESFEMDFRLFDNAKDEIEKLKKIASKSKSIKFEPKKNSSISFKFARGKKKEAKAFLDELIIYLKGKKEDGIIGALMDKTKRKEGSEYDKVCIDIEQKLTELNKFLDMDAKEPNAGVSKSGENGTNSNDSIGIEIEQLKSQITILEKYKIAIDDMAAKAKVSLGKDSKFNESKFTEGVGKLQTAVANWQDLTSRLSKITTASDVINELDEWTNMTGKRTSEEAKKYINELEKYKTALEEVAAKAKVKLEKESKFDEGVEKLQKAVANWEDLTNKLSKIKSASDVVNELNGWTTKTGKSTPEEAEAYYKELEKYKNALEEIAAKAKVKLEKESKFNEGVGKLKEAVANWEDLTNKVKDVNSATDVVNKLDSLETEFSQNPDRFMKDTKTGELVAKGKLLDRIKVNAMLVLNEDDLKNEDLGKMIGYVEKPENIINSSGKNNLGLFKLVKSIADIEQESLITGNAIDESKISYAWLYSKMSNVIKSHNQFLSIQKLAVDYGAGRLNTSGLDTNVKRVFDNAVAYLSFESYKNYWRNIVGSVFATLNTLQDFDEVHNTRALMFYTSQFYSIACIMNEIYGDDSQPTKRAKLNVEIFNGAAKPAPTHFGFPEFDLSVLEQCKFKYKGGSEEDKVVKYLKQYQPMRFIFIQSYYPFE